MSVDLRILTSDELVSYPADVKFGTHKRKMALELTCCVPGCTDRRDRKYRVRFSKDYYCTRHGREVYEREEASRTAKLEQFLDAD